MGVVDLGVAGRSSEGAEGSLLVGERSGVVEAVVGLFGIEGEVVGFMVGWLSDIELVETGFKKGPSGIPIVFLSSARVAASCSAEGEQPVEHRQCARVIIKSDLRKFKGWLLGDCRKAKPWSCVDLEAVAVLGAVAICGGVFSEVGIDPKL